MLLFFVIALLFWTGVGLALFHWHKRPAGKTVRRAVDRAVLPVGGTVRVSLDLLPPAVSGTGAEPHDVVLILDQSSSMGDGPGSAFAAAIRASENFVRRCPESVRIGVVAFNGTASILSPLTSHRATVLRAIGSATSSDGTAIDAALSTAVELLAATPDRRPRTTAILLSDGGSDRQLALAQATSLREHARIITVGFSDSADAELLTAIAGPNGHYCSVADRSALSELFALLASFISEESAQAVIMNEPAHAPAPFQLVSTGELHPIAVRTEPGTTIDWALPVMDPRAVSISYDLVPECPGWHSIARPGGKASWQLPDGSRQVMPAPVGPRVLVLPSMLLWSWPLLNPLFWMLFGKLFCRRRRETSVEVATPEPEPLAISTLPARLAPPQPALYVPRVRPAVIVGLGESGEWALTHLGHLLADRGIASADVALLSVRAKYEPPREQICVGAFVLAPEQKIELSQDLRPYLESLRRNAPPVRRWIPASEWLGRIGPRTTSWIHDRREARLALLQRPQDVELRLRDVVRTLEERRADPTAIVVGSALDAECSGMVAEVAHMLAVAGAQTSAIVSRRGFSEAHTVSDLAALARELERMLLMRGDDVLSDRHDPPVAARQLLDRLIVLRDDAASSAAQGQSLGDVAWQLLVYPDVLRRIPTARVDERRGEVECSVIDESAVHLPDESLWRLIRARALARAINAFWLGMPDGGTTLPPPAEDIVSQWVNAFWTGAGVHRLQSQLLRSGAALLSSAEKAASSITLDARLPAHALYDEQASFAERERRATMHFAEAWCQALLDEAYAERRSGLPTLLVSLQQIESGLQSILTIVGQSAIVPATADASRLAISLYNDLASYIERLRRSVEHWIVRFAGTQSHLGVMAAHDQPLALRIENLRRIAEADILFPSDAIRNEAERLENVWYQQYGSALLAQLRGRVVPDWRKPELVFELAGQAFGDDPLSDIDAFLAPCRSEILSWSFADVIEPVDVPQPGTRFRVGAAAERFHPDVVDVANPEDPHFAGTMSIRAESVADAIGSRESAYGLRYAWPEEANAARVSALVLNVLARRPRPIPPRVVHLLRDTTTLFDFLADLADGRVVLRNGRCFITRGGSDYWIGEPSPIGPAGVMMSNFEAIARQVAIVRRSLDAQPISDRGEPWSIDIGRAGGLVEKSPLVMPLTAFDEWQVWRDIIDGLVLDVEKQREAYGSGSRVSYVS